MVLVLCGGKGGIPLKGGNNEGNDKREMWTPLRVVDLNPIFINIGLLGM